MKNIDILRTTLLRSREYYDRDKVAGFEHISPGPHYFSWTTLFPLVDKPALIIPSKV